MASLTEQMAELQRQQEILTRKIREEEIRNKKLNELASINRLEALIEPITEYLDWIDPENNKGIRSFYSKSTGCINYHCSKPRRWNILNQLEEKNKRTNSSKIKYNESHLLANEEMFVTLLGIIKKQDMRIRKLENVINNTNNLNYFDDETLLPCNR